MKNFENIRIVLCAVLAVLTYCSFNVILNNDFVSYDDGLCITKNPNVVSGLTLTSLKWAFRTTRTGNWIPLTWLSHMLDVEMFGMNPGGHHLTNLILHTLNTILVFLLFYKTTDNPWVSFLTALLFAIHPLRAESVAWASERKDVLSAFFGLLSLWVYVSFTKKKSALTYCLTGVFLILGLMSKAMLVTWPFIFLLLDYWPLRRFSGSNKNMSFSRQTLKPLLLEKIPFFAIVSIFCMIAYNAQKTANAVTALDYIPFYFRIENTFCAYLSYLKQIFLPISLAPLYPLKLRNITHLRCVVSFFSIFTLTGLFIRLRKQKPYLLMGWFWFLGSLVPVLGLVQIGKQAMADRYTYIPSIGISLMVAFIVNNVWRRGRVMKIIVLITTALIVCILMVLTLIQCSYWKNSVILYRHAVAVTKDNYTMHMNYGNVLANIKEFDEAMIQFQQAHQLIPVFAEPFEKMARINMSKGNYKQAVSYLREALTKKNPEHTVIFLNLGVSYTRLNETDLAIDAYLQALRNDPPNIQAATSLGDIYQANGKYEKSLDYYNRALTADTHSITALNKLVKFYMNAESPFYDPRQAMEHAQQTCLITDFQDKESLTMLIQILNQDKHLEEFLSDAFVNKLNQRIFELNGASLRR